MKVVLIKDYGSRLQKGTIITDCELVNGFYIGSAELLTGQIDVAVPQGYCREIGTLEETC